MKLPSFQDSQVWSKYLFLLWLIFATGCSDSGDSNSDFDFDCHFLSLLGCPEEGEPDDDNRGGNVIWSQVLSGNEHEPNDPIENAATIAGVSHELSSIIDGLLNDSDDPEDYFRFGTTSDLSIIVYLCEEPDNCESPGAGDDTYYMGEQIYLELFDVEGNLLQSTYQAQTEKGHEMSFYEESGDDYYVAVKAASTIGANFSYRLVISDSNFYGLNERNPEPDSPNF